jgi:hypothetical protein
MPRKTSPTKSASADSRNWQRLPLAIPVFIRGEDADGKPFIEFATAHNISAGGALVGVQRYLKPGSKVMLEIPCAVVAQPKQNASRNSMNAKLVRVSSAENGHLIGLKFHKPLIAEEPAPSKRPLSKAPAKARAAAIAVI